MKKILLTAATLAVVSTSALADINEGGYGMYVAAEAGASFFQNTNSHAKATPNLIATDLHFKLKSKRAGAILGLGIGGYIMDNVRGELMYNYFTDQHLKLKNNKVNKDTAVKAKAMSILVNGYVDVVDIDAFKVFIGAGVGMARTKENFELQHFYGKSFDYSIKGKVTNRFAYAAYVGASYNLNTGTDLILKYSFRDNGKSKYTKKTYKDVNVSAGHIKHQTHNVSLGLRFDV